MAYGVHIYNASGQLVLKLDDKIYKLAQSGTVNLVGTYPTVGSTSITVYYPYVLDNPYLLLYQPNSSNNVFISYSNNVFTIYSGGAYSGVQYEVYTL